MMDNILESERFQIKVFELHNCRPHRVQQLWHKIRLHQISYEKVMEFFV
jgi:hypothetical protein